MPMTAFDGVPTVPLKLARPALSTVPCPPVELRHLLTIDVAVQPVVDLDAFPLGGRRFVGFDGGTFTGRDGLRGTIAPGGIDWQLARPDGVIEIDAHYLLLTDEGEPVEVRSTGLRKVSDEVAQRIARGDAVAASEYYFRTHIRLSTSAARLAWMNDLIAVSTGERRRDAVRIDVHEIT
jgi:hypothetical protein